MSQNEKTDSKIDADDERKDKEDKDDDEEMKEEKMTTQTVEEKSPKSGGNKKAGVVYLSRIPTKMNVKIIRDYMSQYGDVGRIFLEPREKKRKNQPRSFKEGWVEFAKKRVAKQVVTELNNTQVGGKRRNPWYSELWNMKYLKKFRWTHLNERIAYEQEIRKQRLRQETTLAKKEATFYIQNVEKNEKRKRFESKKLKSDQENGADDEEAIRQNREKAAASSSFEAKKDNDTVANEPDVFGSKRKHPLYDRKTKIAGNDSFLKQIFS